MIIQQHPLHCDQSSKIIPTKTHCEFFRTFSIGCRNHTSNTTTHTLARISHNHTHMTDISHTHTHTHPNEKQITDRKLSVLSYRIQGPTVSLREAS
jgi:type IV secretory pathway component VirB8